MKKLITIIGFLILFWTLPVLAQWKNAWLEVDLTSYTAGQITTFFAIKENTAAYTNLSRPKKLVLQCYWQANPNRIYKSKTSAKKWLIYIHFPTALADELGNLPAVITDNVRYVGRNLKSMSTAIHEEYFTGAGNGRVILNSSETGYDAKKNYPFLNVYAGVEP